MTPIDELDEDTPLKGKEGSIEEGEDDDEQDAAAQ